ncbi:hypothetical protein CPB85DRAFT_1293441, partial [Mucidula mucida]
MLLNDRVLGYCLNMRNLQSVYSNPLCRIVALICSTTDFLFKADLELMFSRHRRRFCSVITLGFALCFLLLQVQAIAARKTMMIKGKTYNVQPLKRHVQGMNSMTYRIIDGYEHNGKKRAAILKVLDASDKRQNQFAEQEVEYLGRKEIKQIYTYDKEQKRFRGLYVWKLVLRDIHEHYPDENSPNLAPLHEIIFENPSLDLEKSVTKLRKLAIAEATRLANSPLKLVYRDMSLLNVWTDKDLSVVVFIDWQPPLVVDISEEALKGKNTNGHAREDDADETDSDDSDDSDDEDEPEPISKAEALRHMKRNVEKDLLLSISRSCWQRRRNTVRRMRKVTGQTLIVESIESC